MIFVPMDNPALRRFTILVAFCTFLLVIAGGLVTSNDAALSVPDWPLSYGKLIPPLEGGIRYEFAHRALAALVAVLTITLAVWIERAERRRWIRTLAWTAGLLLIPYWVLFPVPKAIHSAPEEPSSAPVLRI